jgi:phage tail-like protein
MARAVDIDTLTTFHYGVEISGITAASFDEISGLDAKQEVFEIKEGGVNGMIHKLPGRISYSNVTLKWGAQHNNALWEWYNDFVTKSDKTGELKDISIIQFDQHRDEIQRWNLSKAFPVKWVGPTFKASDNQVAIETLELAYHELTLSAR